MKDSIKLARFAAAVSLAMFLAACGNVAYSTVQSAARIAGIGDVVAGEPDSNPPHDALLAERLTDVLRSDPATSGMEIYVSVLDGHARLSGFVDNAAAKLRAGALVSETDGVDAVENRLILRHRADAERDPISNARVYL